MSALSDLNVFNRPDKIPEGWYWAIPSRELKKGKIKHLRVMGKDLAVYRGESGEPYILDAHCPHMGAHLAEGRVEGESVRCFFHHWKFSGSGELQDIPCREKLHLKVKTNSYDVKEHYGMIWIWVGDQTAQELPEVPELKGLEVDFLHGTPFTKACHPNVMMINAIDANHFSSVHHLPVKLNLEPKILNTRTIQFNNTTNVPTHKWWSRLIGSFYKGPLTYSMCYFNSNTGTVTIGPDFLHFHIMFAIRQNDEGCAEGQTILVTKKRRGLSGRIINSILLQLTRVVGNYFAKGDTEVFKTIKFNFKNPIAEDHAIIRFIQHTEKMRVATWAYSKPSVEKQIEEENAQWLN
jgi:phenylpropionate dioxygenase-like ring-hydroxylating dioxygenase large terminal subunit